MVGFTHALFRVESDCFGEISDFLCLVFLFVEEVLFGLFTCCMFVEQMTSCSSGSNQIDRLKMASDTGSSRSTVSTLYNMEGL
jgi:hypothetical protein